MSKDENNIKDLKSLFQEVDLIKQMENLENRTLSLYFNSLELICGTIKQISTNIES